MRRVKRRRLSACLNRSEGLTVGLEVNPALKHRLVTGFGLSLLAAAPVVAEKGSTLLEASPFVSPRAATSGATPAAPEFRGLVQDNGELMISLFDPQSRTSQWISVPGRGPGLEVKSYDPMTQSVTIIQGAREITLWLKQAPVRLLEPAEATVSEKTSAGADDTGKDAARVTPKAIRDLSPEIRSLSEEYLRRRRTREMGSGDQLARVVKP